MPLVPHSFEVEECMRVSYNLHVQCDVGALAGNLRVKVPVTVVVPAGEGLPTPEPVAKFVLRKGDEAKHAPFERDVADWAAAEDKHQDGDSARLGGADEFAKKQLPPPKAPKVDLAALLKCGTALPTLWRRGGYGADLKSPRKTIGKKADDDGDEIVAEFTCHSPGCFHQASTSKLLTEHVKEAH